MDYTSSAAANVSSSTGDGRTNRRTAFVAVLLLVIVGALITYKTTAALAVLQRTQTARTFQPRANVVPLPGNSLQLNAVQRSINYFLVIGPALIFGILISGAARVLITPRDWGHLLGNGYLRPQLVAGMAGAPLMLCSCCAAPIFSAMYERSSRLGPALATTLAAPSLNPFALVLTFMLFGSQIGMVRLTTALLIVFVMAAIIERLFKTKLRECVVDAEVADGSTLSALLRSWWRVTIRTVPLIVIGVLLSMFVARWLPAGAFSSSSAKIISVLVVAAISVLLALPTFFEIPLALILLGAGAPPAAAVAMLIAGPAVNLPSLLTIGRATNWRVAGTVALSVFVLALVGGLLTTIL